MRVNQAYNIAYNIYLENKDIKSKSEIEKLIKDALRPIRFPHKNGYVFIATIQGEQVLYPLYPKHEGKNVLQLTDEFGNKIIQKEIEVVTAKGEGYVVSNWKKSETDSLSQEKRLFVKLFEPLNWYIGTGEFVEEYNRSVKNDVKEWLANYRFGNGGYIFIDAYDGNAVIYNGKPMYDDVNMWDLTDPNGIKIVQLERETIKNPEGGYIYYSWKRLGDTTYLPKMVFVKGVPEWRWMVGTGVYIEDINMHLAEKKKEIREDILKDTLVIISLIAVIFGLLYLVAIYMSKHLKKNISYFVQFFKSATNNYKLIDKSNIVYSEFETIAQYANSMISELRFSEIRKREEEAHYERLFEDSPEAIAYIGNNYKVIRVNMAFTKLFGYNNYEIVNHKINDFIVPEDRKEKAIEYTKEIEQGNEKSTEDYGITKQGDRIWMSIIGKVVKVQDKKLGIYVVYRNITEQKQHEKILNLAKTKAEESDRLKEFLFDEPFS